MTTIGSYAFSGCTELTTVKVGNSTPVSIASTTFTNRANATLIVPSSAVSAYKTANYWKDFQNILCEEDWVNYLSISELTVEHGAEINLPVSMTNQEQITAAEFNLRVPNGIKLLSCSMTERKNGHEINFVQMEISIMSQFSLLHHQP